jgi:hypothetical protein
VKRASRESILHRVLANDPGKFWRANVDFERVWQENISGVSYPRENEEPSVGGGEREDTMRRQQHGLSTCGSRITTRVPLPQRIRASG